MVIHKQTNPASKRHCGTTGRDFVDDSIICFQWLSAIPLQSSVGELLLIPYVSYTGYRVQARYVLAADCQQLSFQRHQNTLFQPVPKCCSLPVIVHVVEPRICRPLPYCIAAKGSRIALILVLVSLYGSLGCLRPANLHQGNKCLEHEFCKADLSQSTRVPHADDLQCIMFARSETMSGMRKRTCIIPGRQQGWCLSVMGMTFY